MIATFEAAMWAVLLAGVVAVIVAAAAKEYGRAQGVRDGEEDGRRAQRLADVKILQSRNCHHSAKILADAETDLLIARLQHEVAER